MTLAPSDTKRDATARPIPRAAPVMIATFPENVIDNPFIS
jgi:hypothetical protein